MTTIPISEIFRSIQGEGKWSGVPATFIRVQGCEYSCRWCDTTYARTVTPEMRLGLDEILDQIRLLGRGSSLVVLTGGNPALYNLKDLVDELHRGGRDIQVETQGATFQPWLRRCWVTIAPKGPSSGMWGKTRVDLPKFLDNLLVPSLHIRVPNIELKLTIQTPVELDVLLRFLIPLWPHTCRDLTIQPVCPPGTSQEAATAFVDLLELLWNDLPTIRETIPGGVVIRVLPQVHRLVFPQSRGV